MMIGQNSILSWAESNKDNFPHFIVLVGDKGSGKRTLAKELSNELNLIYSPCEIKVDTVREVINTAYHVQTGVMYCFENADTMRNEAKNAMLKITEEPPEHAYFCMTVTDDSYLLDTIKSRAQVLHMEPYSSQQIREYCVRYDRENIAVFENICTTPGEVDLLNSYNVTEFMQYAELVVDNITLVEPSNAFKSSSKLQLKSDGEGYDLGLFWKACVLIWARRMIDEDDTWASIGILCTSPYLNKVNNLGVNKVQLYDKWVFDIREKYMAWI